MGFPFLHFSFFPPPVYCSSGLLSSLPFFLVFQSKNFSCRSHSSSEGEEGKGEESKGEEEEEEEEVTSGEEEHALISEESEQL